MMPPIKLSSPIKKEHLPLVFDSPHSGLHFPDDFHSEVTLNQLKTGWDAYIEKLWQDVIKVGGYLLQAHFSRMYIDPNRAPNDIDHRLLDIPWERCQPTAYSERGMGLIRRLALPGVPIYKASLNKVQIQQRLDNYYRPYHATLGRLLDELYEKFLAVWHINCHSMKSQGNQMNIDSGESRPDIILGDNEGMTADPEFVQVVEDIFNQLGYNVVRNTPYKGGYLINHYADMRKNRHSIQIEINRAIYMNEKEFVPNSYFSGFQKDLSIVAQKIATYIKYKIQ